MFNDYGKASQLRQISANRPHESVMNTNKIEKLN
jgi:hypothetical protein